MDKKTDEKFWYKQDISECPVCGRTDIEKIRIYGNKPADPSEIYTYHQVYDNCMHNWMF